jgi:hypothetical protein
MKKKWISAGIILSLAFLLGPSTASASLLTYSSSHDITLTITQIGGASAAPGSGTFESTVWGSASYNPEESFNNSSRSVAPGTATSSLPGTYTTLPRSR